MKKALIIFTLAVATLAFAKQDQKSNVYQNGDRACMVGDSITAGGWYTSNIMMYYITRFPEMYVDWRNIGISGDGCHGILWRMNWDILPQLGQKQAVSVLMIGM
ncbi:MAG: GDSL family lipase, partial [Opitutales bacterium]|nr:GDSL family lipase [Opitutales bacterium]